MRPWGGFRVVLNRKSRFVFQLDSCYGIVIQVHVGDFHICIIFRIGTYHVESVILGSDLTFSSHQVFDGMVKSTMTVMHFVGRDSHRLCEELMPQTNSKNWLICPQNVFNCFHSVVHHCWISRSIGKEITLRLPGFHLGKGSSGRIHFAIHATGS